MLEHLYDGGARLDLGLNDEIEGEHRAKYRESEQFITHVGLFDESADGKEIMMKKRAPQTFLFPAHHAYLVHSILRG